VKNKLGRTVTPSFVQKIIISRITRSLLNIFPNYLHKQDNIQSVLCVLIAENHSKILFQNITINEQLNNIILSKKTPFHKTT